MEFIEPGIEKIAPYYPKAVYDYLNKSSNIRPFYNYYPNLEGYGEKIIDRTFTSDKRQNLVAALKNQYGSLLQQEGSQQVLKNINDIANENCLTITTGQQIHVYLGPLYVTYKILSAVARCQWLTKNFKGYCFVPVFWMAAEDHDFEEISGVNLYNKEFKWQAPEDYTGAVGRINPSTINTTLESEVAALIQNDEQAKEFLALCTKAYAEFDTLAGATRYIVHTLFKHLGVVVIDGDDKSLKNIFKNYIKDDIFKDKNTNIINLTTAEFEKHYKAQIHPREINFFYLTENGRHRIVKEGGKYKILNTDLEFDEVALTYEVDAHPEKFSPNVALRPLYQEAILPNIAYIGGPGEINYWLQLHEFFKVNGVQFPILELRKSVILPNEKTAAKITSMGFSAVDFVEETRQLEDDFIGKNASGEIDLSAHYKNINAEFEAIKIKSMQADNSLKSFFDGEMVRMGQTFEKIDGKLQKAGKKQFEGQLQQIALIKEKFFKPGGLPERAETLLSQPQLLQKQALQNLLAAFNQANYPLIIVLPPLI